MLLEKAKEIESQPLPELPENIIFLSQKVKELQDELNQINPGYSLKWLFRKSCGKILNTIKQPI